MTTMRDIAVKTGVSLKTVSRVFNDDPHVRPEIRERVRRALAESGYVPNELSQTFRTGRGRVIGVAVPSLIDPFYGAIVESVGAEAAARGYGTVVTSTGFDPLDEIKGVTSLRDRRVSGLILAPVSAEQSYLSEAVPTVLVDQPAVGVDVDSFVHEDRRGAWMATSHLLAQGFTRIGFLGRAANLATTQERLAGYREALSEGGVDPDDTLVVSDVDSSADVAESYHQLQERGLDALFTADPRTTMSCLRAMRNNRVALVGFGDFPLADLLSPSISVIDQNPMVMGRRASQRLFEIIERGDRTRSEGMPSPVSVKLPVSLLERQSSMPPH
jgi:LacI family transcriptional regulator